MLSLVLHKTAILVEAEPKTQNLGKELNTWVNSIDLKSIESDDVVIRVLGLMTAWANSNDQQVLHLLDILKGIESVSENKHMKVAIFDFVLGAVAQQNLQNETKEKLRNYLKSLLAFYSNPAQLEDLR